MSKRKGEAKKVISWILSLAIIVTVASGIFAYNKNAKFKSKINDILKIEESTKEPENKEPVSLYDYSGEISELKQQLTDANEKLASISKPNLVMNPNFEVNQRGRITYTRSGTDIYTADRWCLVKGNGTFKTSTKTLTGLDETSPTILCQWIESGNLMTYGQTVTASADINGVRYSATVTIAESFTEDVVYNLFEADGCLARIYIRKGANVIGIQFLVENGTAVVIEKVKLELSEYETKYEEPSKPEEQLRCYRYYQKILPAGIGFGSNETSIMYYSPITVPVYSQGDVVIKTAPKVLIDGELVTASNITLNRKDENMVVLIISDLTVVKNQPYTIVNGSVYIDAEFYIEF